uniref:hypothetical protein n=1 Tax=Crassiphycus birdiae TaxID=2782747 RepID=UPI001D10C5B1|nr:hypothetical protein LK100_pgp144 [Crassiphycus birdiae]UAD83103.1 hypothetical protein [Crassiphycus birdiae]
MRYLDDSTLNFLSSINSLNTFNTIHASVRNRSLAVKEVTVAIPKIFNKNQNQNNYQLVLSDIPSKIANTASNLFISIQYHKDCYTKVDKTLSCNSSEKFNKNRVIVKKTDTNKAKFQSAKKDFFDSSSKPIGN